MNGFSPLILGLKFDVPFCHIMSPFKFHMLRLYTVCFLSQSLLRRCLPLRPASDPSRLERLLLLDIKSSLSPWLAPHPRLLCRRLLLPHRRAGSWVQGRLLPALLLAGRQEGVCLCLSCKLLNYVLCYGTAPKDRYIINRK